MKRARPARGARSSASHQAFFSNSGWRRTLAAIGRNDEVVEQAEPYRLSRGLQVALEEQILLARGNVAAAATSSHPDAAEDKTSKLSLPVSDPIAVGQE
jgi:hypothetical protein